MTLVGEKYISIEKCAELAGVTEQTVRQYTLVGLLKTNENDEVNLKEASRVLYFADQEAQPVKEQFSEIQGLLLTQLAEVKEERDWLKQRVEKLEQSIERTQILAISSKPSEINRQPFWRSLLPQLRKESRN